MKKNVETVFARERTHPILLRAFELMKMYARATGACVSIHGHNYMPIPELAGEMIPGKNMCRFCMEYRNRSGTDPSRGFSANLCKDMHINAIKESYRFGGSYMYACDLGFVFWTSPIYLNGRFAGALVGGGYLGSCGEETRARMYSMCGGALDETEIAKILGCFPQGESRKLPALAELMFMCAQNLSVESEGCHAAMKRRLEQQSDLSAKIEDLKNQYPPGSARPEYPLGKEQTLLEDLRRGDERSAKQTLNEILAYLFFANPDQFKFIQCRAIELAVLLSRIDTGPGFAARIILEANNRHIKTIEDAKSIEELIDALYRIFDETAGQIRSFRGIQHAAALKKAEYYILDNFSRKLSLEEISGISGFSAPYFSTIFKEEMGENLSNYLNRLRVEKAVFMLTDTSLSLGKIAQTCGFEDQSWFSKIFKLYTGISPGKCRNQGGRAVAKIPEPVFSGAYRRLVESQTGAP